MEKLDRIDFQILSHLQEHGRMTNVGLANAVGLSTSPCLYRVKRLENIGYIKSYGARIALELLGDHLIVFTEVTLTGHRIANFSRFLQRAGEVHEIIECHHVTGGYDYLLKVIARSVGHYQTIMEQLLEGDAGIGKYSCYVVLGSPIVREGYPIGQLFDPSLH